ncbi:hypothetical protein [Lacinutrix sp. MEBiC02595]
MELKERGVKTCEFLIAFADLKSASPFSTNHPSFAKAHPTFL